MKAIWSGRLSVGLVNIPVKLYTATEDKDVKFHMLHESCGSRVEYKKFCADEQEEIDNGAIVKGYEVSKGKNVVITEAMLSELPVPSKHAIEIDKFVDLDSIDPLMLQKSYYLEPGEGGGRGYRLITEALRQTRKGAIAQVTLREKSHTAFIRPRGNTLALTTLFQADEIRDGAALAPTDTIKPAELKFAVQLVKSLSGRFDPNEYKDDYREALLTRIADLAASVLPELPAVMAKPKIDNDSLFAALKASVAAAQKKGTKAGPKATTASAA